VYLVGCIEGEKHNRKCDVLFIQNRFLQWLANGTIQGALAMCFESVPQLIAALKD